MAVIKAFKALRPTKDSADKVASVPYDVVNTEEAKQLAEENPLSFLRVTRSEIELKENIDPYSPEVYKKAKENLQRLISQAPLKVDESEHFYLYRLEMEGRAQIGIAAAFSVDDYDNNVILKHEKTRKVKEDDRTNHIVTTGAQTGPVFLTYKPVKAVDKIVEETIKNEKPLYDFTSSDGIKHTIWSVPEKNSKSIVDEIAKVKNLYIADGHHRAASASRARKVKQESNPNHSGKEEYNYFLAVLFPADQLKILSYNRVVLDLNGKSKDEFLNEVIEKFQIEKTNTAQPDKQKTFGMFLDGEWYVLKPRDLILASNSLSKSIAETLDVSILQDFLLNPILDIDDPRTNKRIDFVGGIRGTKELEKLVNTGRASVAFSLFPVSVDDLMNISDAGEIMPPKSTWFEPKLRDGLLVHLI
ncbi:MAG: DUF1015 family protein [Bacteroidetes bacterium]|nr:DUF1015 family protein [Bacteroidota bacterium]